MLHCLALYLFPRVILYNFVSEFCSFMVVWGFGVEVLDLVFGDGFPVDWVCGLWCGAFWVFLGWGSLYKHKRINLGKMVPAECLALQTLTKEIHFLISVAFYDCWSCINTHMVDTTPNELARFLSGLN